MAQNMKKLIVICIILAVSGCANNLGSLETHQQTGRIDNHLATAYAPSESSTEEYVNRIGKKVLLVSDRPDANYNFRVLDDSNAVFSVNYESKSVIISSGVLHQLKDEAQLAAALALGIASLNNVTAPDKDAAYSLSRAGYDPHAVLELQQQYFNAANNNQPYWLQGVYPTPPTAGSIANDELMLKKMPQGLYRGAEDYHKELNG